MVGFMNHEALDRTVATGFATFFSRTRRRSGRRGKPPATACRSLETLVDCDEDTVLLKVRRLGDGNVCHTGTRTCFKPLEPGS